MRKFDKITVITEANKRLETEYLKSKTLIKEEPLKGIFGFGKSKKDPKIEQAKKEIEQTDFNNLFIQPKTNPDGTFNMGDGDEAMITRQLKKLMNERIPTVISLFPDLVSGDAAYFIKVRLRGGQLINGLTMENLGPFIVGDYLTIDNDVAKRRLNKKLEDLENIQSPS